MGKISKSLNATARLGLYGALGLLATKLYDGYQAVVGSSIAGTVGEAVDKSDAIVKTAEGMRDAARVVADSVSDAPVVSSVVGDLGNRLSSCVPHDGKSLLAAAGLTVLGCALLRSGQNFARQPLESLRQLRSYSRGREKRSSWERIKTCTGGIWDRFWHAPVYAPFVPLGAWACNSAEPLRAPGGEVTANVLESVYSFWRGTGAPEWLSEAAQHGGEFVVKYAIPMWAIYKMSNYAVRKYEKVAYEMVDCFRSRRKSSIPGAAGY